MNVAMAFYNVDAKMKDNEIRNLVTSGLQLLSVSKSHDGALLSVDGYDADPRDLWHIPEAVSLAKKLVSFGVMSVLTISTTLDPKWNDSPAAGRPFGAFELWLLAKEELGTTIEGERLINLFDQFKIELGVSNEVATALAEGRINDGQH